MVTYNFLFTLFLSYVCCELLNLPQLNTHSDPLRMDKPANNEDIVELNGEIKALQSSCVNTCLIIENAPPGAPCMDEDEVTAKTNNYIEGLRTEVHNSNPLILSNNKILTSQFLNELKEKITHIEELSSLTKAYIQERDTEIERLKSLLSSTKEAIMKPKRSTQDLKPEHILKAREKFVQLKNEIHSLVECLFPDCHLDMASLMGELMAANNDSSYVPITPENYKLAVMLKDMNIVSYNPYNIIMTYINITSVKLFVKVQNVFGMCKVAACLIVIGGGIYEIAKGNTGHLNKGFEGSTTSPGGIALALYSGLWAYDGWNSVNVVTEEIINPGVNVPLSISIAVPLITALYVFMNVAYMTVLSYGEMVSVPAVAVAFGARVLGPASFLIPLGVAIATFGCAMSVQFGVTRVCYTAARGGHMLEAFSYVNVLRLTPAPAVAFQCLLTSIFISVGNIQTLIEFASWFLWFFYGLAMVALLVLRKTHANTPRPYKVPIPVPCFVLLVAIFLSVLPIVHDPSLKYVMAVGFILIGIAVYTTFVYYKKTPTNLLRKFTFLIQVLFQSVPPSKQED